MANTVIALKKSGTVSAAPSSLANGEIAINYADGKLFYKNVTGSIVAITSGAPSSNSFATINANGSLITAISNNSTLTFVAGQNIGMTSDIINDIITITANLKPAFDQANSANLLAYNTGIGANAWANSVGTAGNNYTVYVGASANNWANTKLSNTDNVIFNGSLQVPNTLYVKDLVISNTMFANISGNVHTLYIQDEISHVNSIFFATNAITSANGQVVAGQLTWNPDDLTLDVGTGISILQLGQEQYYRVINQSGETIYNSNAVAYYGTTGSSGKLKVRKAIANNSYDSKQILGIATSDILNGAEGLITTFGKVRKIDTSMFSEGDILYVSSSIPGALQNTKPSAPNNKVQIGTVITSSPTVGMIFASVQRGSSLADDELASFTNNGGLVDGDLIRYVSANDRFENVNENSTGPAINAIAAFAKANAANLMAYSANGWANTVGTAGNNYASILIDNVASAINANAVTSYSSINSYSTTIGTAGNNYASILVANTAAAINANASASYAAINSNATSIGTAGNNYTNTVGTAGNNYTNYVGASANAYATATYYPKTGGTVSGDVVITGNLTVSGNTTYANTQTLLIGDNILTLNADLPGSVSPSENAGLEVNRGNKNANAALLWIEAANAWSLTSNTLAAISTYIASNTLVETYATAGNNYVSTSLTATNNYTNSVGTAGNNYSQTLVTAANNWANTKVDSITSNSTRIWANSTVTSGIEVVNIDLAQSGVTAGVYGNSSIIPIITVDAYGRVTSIANVATSGGSGGASVNVGTTAPAAPTAGNLWWNTNEGTLYIYYTDVDSSQWVQASPMTNPAPVVTGGYYQGNRGTVGETAGLGDIFRVHANTITADITIPGGYNALAAGPLSIQTGKKLTIGDGARAVIV